MTQPEFEVLAKQLLDHCQEIRSKKSPDYSEQADCLDNFKRDAEEFGTTVYQAWSFHWHKHIRAVKKFVKNGQVASEPIRERIADAINYFLLLDAIIQERNDVRSSTPNS